MFDVIVVGARCAGAAVSLLLARRGYRVLMLDRATFPSDTISGHCILHPGTVRLARWGLLEQVVASKCPPLTHILTNFDDFTLSSEVGQIDGIPPAIGPRRTVLDQILIEAAVNAGVEFREACSLTGLLTDEERVTGVRYRAGSGRSGEARSHLVIGADGMHSTLARLVEAPVYVQEPSLTCWYLTYLADYPCQGLEIHWRPRRAVITMPTNDGLVLAAVAWPHDEFPSFRSDIEGNFVATMRLMPEIDGRLPGARRAAPFTGMSRVPGFFRRSHGPGWALVGDAGHFKDPLPAYGISDAFCDAELLAGAVDDGLSGRVPLAAALAGYERRRDARALPDHQETTRRATLVGWDQSPLATLRAAVRDDEAGTRLFHAMVVKAITPEDLRHAVAAPAAAAAMSPATA